MVKIRNTKQEILITLVVIIFTVLLIVFGSCYLKDVKQAQVNETKNHIEEISRHTSRTIEYLVTTYVETLGCIASFVSSEYYNEQQPDAALIQSILEREAKRSGYNILRYEDFNGLLVVADQNGENSGLNNFNNYFIYESFEDKSFSISETVWDSTYSENVNIVSIPVYASSKRIGTLSAAIKSAEIEQLLISSVFNDTRYALVADNNGKIVIRNSYKSKYYKTVDLFSGDSKQSSEIQKIIAEMTTGASGVAFYSANGQEEIWISYSRLSFNNWYVLTMIPNSVVNTEIKKAMKITAVFVLLSVLFTVCLAIIIDCILAKNRKLMIKAAYTDELTGYRNKYKFKLDMEEILAQNRLTKYAIVMLDIDNFKTFNELFGFDEGDKVLKYTADVINTHMHDEEIFARSTSDNYYMLIKYDSKEEIKKRLRDIMDEISAYSNEKISTASYSIICYCGVYKINYKNYERGANFLLDRARLALMRIVRNHRNGYAFYNDIFRTNIVYETEIENSMEHALENEEFKVYIQPKYDLEIKKVVGGEALIRWQHPTKGFLTPDKFIPVFEKNNFVTKIDMYVLEQVCKMQSDWVKRNYNPVVISVNQSRLNLYTNNYVEIIKDILEKYNTPPEFIELEITESIAYENMHNIINIIDSVHKIGLNVSMDDFGSGYSSLNMLKNINVDSLKIDKDFFENSTETKRGQVIIASVVEMANRLNIETVAEGIETKEQADFLKAIGCNIAQGFFYSRPVPSDEFEEILRNGCILKDIE